MLVSCVYFDFGCESCDVQNNLFCLLFNVFFFYRGTPRQKTKPCPVSIAGLVELHNVVMKFKNTNENSLSKQNLAAHLISKDKFKKAWEGWPEYAKNYTARIGFIRTAPRLEPTVEGTEIVILNPGFLVKKREFTTTIKCSLVPNDDGSPFVTGYEAAWREYNSYSSGMAKITAEQLNKFCNLLIMEVKYLAGCDVEWKMSGESEGVGEASGGGSSQGKNSAVTLESLSILPGDVEFDHRIVSYPKFREAATDNLVLGAIAHLSLSELESDSRSTGPASSSASAEISLEAAAGAQRSPTPATPPTLATSSAPPPPPPPPPAAATAVSIDFSNIADWDHRSGNFPLTDEALQQMQFVEAPRPKHYYAAALLLFMRPNRTNREEIVFQNLMEMWPLWFDRVLNYDEISKKPPISYSRAEVNWCQVRLEILLKDIKNPDDRKKLGLPQLTLKKNNTNCDLERNTAKSRRNGSFSSCNSNKLPVFGSFK